MGRPGPLARLRRVLAEFAENHLRPAERWAVALSGGPDSLALTAAAAGVLPTTALIVDHGLQHRSAAVVEVARDQAVGLGCVDTRILRVEVGGSPGGFTGGIEAAARTARYAALDTARVGAPVLLGHTLDDQAETVLLGLGRGSGTRSLAGMRPYDPPWCRPLLAVRRAVTHDVCAELGLAPWSDPHNVDRRFVRARLRNDVLPLLEDVLGGGVAEALARTATALRENTDLIDSLAAQVLSDAARGGDLAIAALAALPGPVRRTVVRSWLLAGGATGLTDGHIRAVDRLVTAWRGQGGVAVGSDLREQRLVVHRRSGLLRLKSEPV